EYVRFRFLSLVDENARTATNEGRNGLGALLKRTPDGLRQEPGSVKWWTFAGGRINQTLKYAFERECGWKVVPDNFSLRIEGDGVSLDTVHKSIADFRTPGYWDHEDRRRKLLALMPEYRLSKFQRVLPDRYQTEMLGAYLLDFRGTGEWLASGAR